MNTSRPVFSIPQPCAQSWAAMVPTAAGRHCGVCQTEVVDFTRLSEAEVLAYLTARKGPPVCAYAHFAPPAPLPVRPWRRWLLAGLALLGWQPLASCGAKPPQQPPSSRAAAVGPTAGSASVVVRGVVLDDSLAVPVGGAEVYVGNTKYGVIADERGEFVLTLPADWEPLKTGTVELRIARVPFVLLEQTVEVSVKNNLTPAPLAIRLLSVPERGRYKGKPVMEPAPVPVPQGRKARR